MSGTTNRAFLGAYRKGYEAALAGEPVTACPYTKADATDTYSSAFARYWTNGWQAAQGEIAQRAAKGVTA